MQTESMTVYGKDIKERVIAFIESGGSKLEASRRFNVSRPSIDRWLLLKATTGSLALPKLKPRKWRKLDPQALIDYVSAHPDKDLSEYAAYFGLSPSGIWRALKRLKMTRKKSPPCIKSEMKKSVQHL